MQLTLEYDIITRRETNKYTGHETDFSISYVYCRGVLSSIKEWGGCISSIFFINTTTKMSKRHTYTPTVDVVASTFLITWVSTSTNCTCQHTSIIYTFTCLLLPFSHFILIGQILYYNIYLPYIYMGVFGHNTLWMKLILYQLALYSRDVIGTIAVRSDEDMTIFISVLKMCNMYFM